jgi:predicted MFS family arabinose efflux permease
MAIAPTVGIFIYKLTDSFELLFWLALAVACAGWLTDVTVKTKQPTSNRQKDDCNAKNKPQTLSWDRFFLLRGWLLGINMVAFGFSFGVLSNYLAIYGKEVMGITGGTGTYFMLCSVGLILSRLQGGKALRQGRLTFNAGSGMVISFIGYTLFILVPNMVGYYASALLIGLGNGHMWPAFQNMTISVASNSQRGTANSTILVSWDLGMGIGILLGGVVVEYTNYAVAFWGIAAVQAIGALMFFAVTRKVRGER